MMNYLVWIILPLVLGIWAQVRISSTYRKWAGVASRKKFTGAQVARMVMESAGIQEVEIVEIPGQLTDHYNPTERRLALSRDNYHGTSLAALGVAAHEAGHAIQHRVGYAPLKARAALIPVTNFASQLLPFVILGGFFFGLFGLIKLGVAIYLVLTIFQLVTLPVEFDASRRAKEQLLGLNIIDADEAIGVVETLNAAGWTYVAAFVASLGNLVYLISLINSSDRD
jgi:Zn-dependent membrane protease YugP